MGRFFFAGKGVSQERANRKVMVGRFPVLGILANFDKRQQLRVISRRALRECWEVHPDCEQQMKAWFREVSAASWMGPAQIRAAYPSASFLSDNRVVFNIRGNHYRIVVRINYAYGLVWIRFAGTHAEFDRIDATKI